MQIYGYTKKGDFVELREATVVLSDEETEKLAEFTADVGRRSQKPGDDKYAGCHWHYRDWDDGWNAESSDLIIMTDSEKTKQTEEEKI